MPPTVFRIINHMWVSLKSKKKADKDSSIAGMVRQMRPGVTVEALVKAMITLVTETHTRKRGD